MSTASAHNSSPKNTVEKKPFYKDPTHMLYLSVIAAVIIGCVLGLTAPGFAKGLAPIGTGFIALIKMMIAPVIFCTIVLGVGSIAKAATVGKVGGMALLYFVLMSTFALGIGLVVGNIIEPGSALHYDPATTKYTLPNNSSGSHGGGRYRELPAGHYPHLPAFCTDKRQHSADPVCGSADGFCAAENGPGRTAILKFLTYCQALVFRLLMMIMWLAPLGALGAIAAVVGSTGLQAISSMFVLMVAFYITCILFVVVVLGSILKLYTGVNIFSLLKYLAREYLLIFSTSSSEAALPRLIAKMEHLGVSKPVVGVVVPTGYSFNLDGTAIYLTMSALFVAEAMGTPLALGEQLSLLVFMIIASKGAAGVSGAGIATLAGGLQSHRPDLVNGVGLIVGIDRFMSEARAVTNFTGNAVATVLMGKAVKEIDMDRVHSVLKGELPFDENTMGDALHGDQYVDDAVAQKSPTKQIPVVPPENIKPRTHIDSGQ